jgi:hypothetical protein
VELFPHPSSGSLVFYAVDGRRENIIRLNREGVAALWPVLRQYAETGQIGEGQ